MDKLQHVQNAAVRLNTGTAKYERGLSRLMHDDLQSASAADQQSGIHCLCAIQLLTPNNLGVT